MDQPEMESQTVNSAATEIEALLGEGEEELETETDEVEAEDVDEVEEEEPEETEESDEEPDGESDEESEEAELETEEQPIATLEELAEALEDENLLDTLQTQIKVDGKVESVTLTELKAGYQKDADYRRKTGELAENRRHFEEQYSNAKQQVEAQLVQTGKIMELLEGAFLPQLDEAEMAHLRVNNPAEWAARKQDHADKAQYIQQVKQHAAQLYEQNTQQKSELQMQQQAQIVERAREELLTRIPDWNDDLKGNIDTYLTGEYGYTNDDLAQVVDPRLVDLARKAWLYDNQTQTVEVAKKKVKSLPKVVKPTKAKTSNTSSRLSKAKRRLAQTHNVKDAASAIEQLL